MTVLLITYGLPLPMYGGSGARDFNTLQCLAREHTVILFCHAWAPDYERHFAQLRNYCETVEAVPVRRSPWRKSAAIARGLRAGRPLALFPYYFEEMAAKIRRLFATREIGLVQIEQSFLAPYIDVLPSPRQCHTVLSFHNIASNQYRSMMRMDFGPFQKALYYGKALSMSRWEAGYAARFDRCIVVSSRERDLLRLVNPELPVSVVPNGVDARCFRPLPEPPAGNTVIFVGNMAYAPNVDAARYFCYSILPLLRKMVPEVKLLIAGFQPPGDVLKLGDLPGVQITGTVPDLIPYYRRSSVAVAPLRAGGGTRVKILEAMAVGRPVVSTSVGCEGLEVTDGEHIRIADTPQAFANGVSDVLRNRSLAVRLSENARRLVESSYDWPVVNRKLMESYYDTCGCCHDRHLSGTH